MKKLSIKMRSSQLGCETSESGVSLDQRRYKAGEIYEVSEDLAEAFVAMGYAEFTKVSPKKAEDPPEDPSPDQDPPAGDNEGEPENDGQPQDLEALTVNELKELAGKLEVEVPKNIKKALLIEALKTKMNEAENTEA